MRTVDPLTARATVGSGSLKLPLDVAVAWQAPTMLRDIHLTARDADDGRLYEPATREVELTVIDGTAHFTVSRRWHYEQPMTQECTFEVPARSLLLALRAAYEDDRGTGAWCDDLPEPRRESESGPASTSTRPAQSHKPWTGEMDQQLRDTWLSLAEDAPARQTMRDMATTLERSAVAIESRLRRVGCDPDRPGHMIAPLQGAGDVTDVQGRTMPD